jgi:hypothetical protein
VNKFFDARDSEVNPYASPTIPGGYDSSGHPGIGVWRDGSHLVFHKQSILPPICIETGQPAYKYRSFELNWTYPIDLWTRRLNLLLPLCRDSYRTYWRRKMAENLSIALPFAIAVALVVANGEEVPLAAIWTIGGTFLVGSTVWGLMRWMYANPVKFVRKRESYFWVSGVDPRFLAQLPEWTAER